MTGKSLRDSKANTQLFLLRSNELISPCLMSSTCMLPCCFSWAWGGPGQVRKVTGLNWHFRYSDTCFSTQVISNRIYLTPWYVENIQKNNLPFSTRHIHYFNSTTTGVGRGAQLFIGVNICLSTQNLFEIMLWFLVFGHSNSIPALCMYNWVFLHSFMINDTKNSAPSQIFSFVKLFLGVMQMCFWVVSMTIAVLRLMVWYLFCLFWKGHSVSFPAIYSFPNLLLT